MTKEEIAEARRVFSPSGLRVLDALEEAHREIEELKNRVHVVLDCNSFKREGRHWAGCPFYVAESTT